jgi:hypothetical protein
MGEAMNRVSVVAVTLASAAAAAAAAATMAPAMAASRPAAARPAAHHRTITQATTAVERASLAAGQSTVPGLSSANIAAESDGGKYLTVVHCAGVDTPPPIRVGGPGTPLTASGTGPSGPILAMLTKPNPYKTIYTCTVSVEIKTAPKPVKHTTKHTAKKKTCEIGTAGGAGGAGGAAGGRSGAGCTKTVTLNTGFGGMAGQVAHHRPAS